MIIDLFQLAEILRQAGQQEIEPRYRNLASTDIGQKADAYDLVTEADIQAERLIADAIRLLHPTALIVGEEAFSLDQTILAGLAHADLAFIIDPVDGTFNFASGNGMFGSILAVVRNGETIGGIICDPLRGDVLLAEHGAGARLMTASGQVEKLSVAPPTNLDEMVSVICWSYLDEPLRQRVANNLAGVKLAMSYGCSAYEYWMLASGHAHFSAAQNMMPWDHLAGTLIHKEAGGFSARFDGSAYRVGQIDGGLLAAPDQESWKLIRTRIIGD